MTIRLCRRSDDAPYKPFPLPGDRPHYPPDRTADIRHIRLELSDFNFESRDFSGRCVTTLSPLTDDVQSVTFDAVELQIERVADGDGRPLTYDYDGTRLQVQFAVPPREGIETTVAVHYRCTPRRGLYFNVPDDAYPKRPRQIWSQGQDEDSRHWFPCIDAPIERQSSELIATVPAGMFALSNGSLVERSEDADGRTETFHWSQEFPHPSYLITLAVGDFAELRHEVDGVQLQYYVERGREAEAERALARTPAMMRFFVERLQYPYPYPKYAQVFVADFIFGGMENTSATTLTDTVLHDERAALDFDADGLVAHELAHQWFGDLLTCRAWGDAWLNEGFATYWEALFTEHHKGLDEFRHEMWQNAKNYFDEDADHYRRPIVQHTYNEPIDIFDRHLYEKGSLVLHMLRGLLGDEGFFKAMRRYVKDNAGRNVTTADLRDAVEAATGKNLDWFFDQWVHKGGHPVFEVAWSWDSDRRRAKLTVKQTQPDSDVTGVFRAPVELSFSGGWGETAIQVEIEDREQSFYVTLPERPSLVRFDPGNRLLKALTFEKEAPELIDQLRADTDVTGRIRAAEDLGKLATREAVTALATAVRDDAFWGVQAAAARALGAARTTAARDALIGLVDIAHPKARRAVVEALGEFRGDQRAADALLALVERGDPSYFVEGEAAKSLGRIRSARAFDALLASLAKDSWNETIRGRALEGLGELKDPRGVAVALDWTAAGRPQPARTAAITALEKLGALEGKTDAVVERLTELLDDPWLRVVTRSIGALRALKAEQALPALQRLTVRHLDGRAIRLAREAIRAIEQGSARSEAEEKLRDRLDTLERDNRDLRDRLAALEERLARP